MTAQWLPNGLILLVGSTTPFSITNESYRIDYGMLWFILLPNENRETKSFYHTGTGVHI